MDHRKQTAKEERTCSEDKIGKDYTRSDLNKERVKRTQRRESADNPTEEENAQVKRLKIGKTRRRLQKQKTMDKLSDRHT